MVDHKKKYSKYCEALSEIVPKLKKQIADSPDGTIVMKVKDLTKKMGPEFEKLHTTSIYWGVKYNLFQEDIVVATTKKDDELVLVMRDKIKIDLLPPSLMKAVGEGDIPACTVTKKRK